MNNYQVLNKTGHQSLRVVTDRAERYGDNVMYALTFPMEFRDVQSCYPIFFTKEPETGQFFATALFGLEQNQNLFLSEAGWDASYIPMMIRKNPFLIANQMPDKSDPGNVTPVVSIDVDDPRVSETQGEVLFGNDGEATDYLKQVISLLEKIHRSYEHNRGFIAALLKYELLESFTLDLTLNDGSKKSLQGFYTIAEENLYKLDGATLEELNSNGYLQPIFMAIASFSRVRPLIDKKNVLQS